MPITVLRPVETVIEAGWAPTGAATIHAATSDQDDSTYASAPLNGTVRVRYEPLSIPAGARISAVRLGVRNVATDSNQRTLVELRYDDVKLGTGGRIIPAWLMTHGASVATAYTAWHDAATWELAPQHPGTAWTVERINDGYLWLTRDLGAAGARIHELEVWVEWNRRPDVSISEPGAIVEDTTRPAIRLDYTDDDGDPQASWEVRLFEGTVAGDVEEAPAGHLAGSGLVTGSGNLWTPPDLEDGQTYTALARVGQIWGGAGGAFRSLWRAHTFAMDLDQPDAPTVTIDARPEIAAIELEISPGPDGAAATPEAYRVEWSDVGPSGPWEPARWGALSGPGPHVLPDHEARFSRERWYRIRASIEIDGLTISSPSTIVSETLVVPGPVGWLVDVRDPARLNVRVEPTEERERIWHGREVAHQPADSPYSIVESETPWRSDVVAFLAIDPAAHDALVAAFGSTRTLLYRDDRREHHYLRIVGDRARTQVGARWVDADRFEATTVEVARPPA